MRLRARLALVALALMLVPIIVMSLISLDSRIDTMIEDMSRSTDFMIEQIFEQVRLALEQNDGDVASKLKTANRCGRCSIPPSLLAPESCPRRSLEPTAT